MSLSTVTVGAPTLASDVNQIINLLNGSAAGAIIIANGSVPGADTPLVTANALVADANPRAALYVRSDGYGGIEAGNAAAAPTAQLYATANGWQTDVPIYAADFRVRHGTQETGKFGFSGYNDGTGTAISQGVNYHSAMFQTPSSIGYSVQGSTNLGGMNAAFIDTHGFQAWAVPSTTGEANVIGTYSTAGN